MELRFVLGRERCGDSYNKDIRGRRALGEGAHTGGDYCAPRLVYDGHLPQIDESKRAIDKNDNKVICTICMCNLYTHFL